MYLQLLAENRCSGFRQFSVVSEFAKQLKGEAKSNPEFEQSVKELGDKFELIKEELVGRTKRTTEKLYKSVDDVWAEAEATSKKVSANLKERFSATTEELKESLGLGKEAAKSANSGSVDNGPNSMAGANHSQSSEQSDSLFSKFKSTLSSLSPTVSFVFQKINESKVSAIAKKGYDIVKEELISDPSRTRRMRYQHTTASSDVRSTKTDIVVVPSKKSQLHEKWEALKNKMEGHPVFKHIKRFGQPVVRKGEELREDLREIWETSDSPIVHRIQDLHDNVFMESDTALSIKEIRQRDPYFSLPDFIAEVEETVKPVLSAYQKGDLDTLEKYCTHEMIERCEAEHIAYEKHGLFFDSKILHISELYSKEIKMMGSTPIIIIEFQTQQIYCVRDREGSITDGGKDTIHTVIYQWAMQQIDMEELGEGALYPIWKLRQMQQLGAQVLI